MRKVQAVERLKDILEFGIHKRRSKRFYDEMNWRTVLDFLRYLHQRYPKLLIIWDDAPWLFLHRLNIFMVRNPNIKGIISQPGIEMPYFWFSHRE